MTKAERLAHAESLRLIALRERHLAQFATGSQFLEEIARANALWQDYLQAQRDADAYQDE